MSAGIASGSIFVEIMHSEMKIDGHSVLDFSRLSNTTAHARIEASWEMSHIDLVRGKWAKMEVQLQ